MDEMENQSPPHSFWTSGDYSEECVEMMKSFIEYMRNTTNETRRGEHSGRINLSSNWTDSIIYHDVLLPHWREFVDALNQYHHWLDLLADNDATCFEIEDLQLPKTVLDMLAIALKPNHFRSLKFQNNMMGHDGISFLIDIIPNNPHLKKLEYHYNEVDNADDVDQLSNVVANHPSLTDIDFQGCRGSLRGFDFMKTLVTGCGAKVLRINLSCCDILTMGGDTFLSDFLTTNPCLEWLGLDGNHLDDIDAIFIATSLKFNTNLKFLSLMQNSITDSGGVALKKAVCDSSSLHAAAASNHICEVVFDINDGSIYLDDHEIVILNHHGHPGGSVGHRGGKLYSIVSSRNRECSNVQHLDDGFPPEAIPNLLGSIQIYAQHFQGDFSNQGVDPIRPLSIVYEIMRGWKIPLLYEYTRHSSSTK